MANKNLNMRFLVFVALLLVLAGTVAAARKHILFISLGLAGHVTPLAALADEMSQMGYQITFASEDTAANKFVQNSTVHHLILGRLEDIFSEAEQLEFRKIAALDDSLGFQVFQKFADAQYPTLFATLWKWKEHFNGTTASAGHPKVDALMNKIMETSQLFKQSFYYPESFPSLIVYDFLSFSGVVAAKTFQLPTVSLNFFASRPESMNIPNPNSPFIPPMSLSEKLQNFVGGITFFVKGMLPIVGSVNKVKAELDALVNDTAVVNAASLTPADLFTPDAILLQSVIGFEYAIDIKPHEFFVGPFIPRNLPSAKDHSAIDYWLSVSKTTNEPILYIAFGTLVYLDDQQAAKMTQAVELLVTTTSWRVLWATKEQDSLMKHFSASFAAKLPSLGDKLRIEKWVPQLFVLQHENVKAFFSHCGGNSIHEALYFGKPILGLPFFADQPSFSGRLVFSGAGLRMDKNSFTAQETVEKVQALQLNKSFAENAQRISALLRNTGGVSKAAEIVDSIVKAGTQHLKPFETRLPFLTRTNIDVYSVLALAALVAFLVLRFITRLLFCRKVKRE